MSDSSFKFDVSIHAVPSFEARELRYGLSDLIQLVFPISKLPVLLILCAHTVGCATLTSPVYFDTTSDLQDSAVRSGKTTQNKLVAGTEFQNSKKSIPNPGEVVSIHDLSLKHKISVRFGQNYLAASGRRCAYYFTLEDGNGTPATPLGITCLSDAEGWIRIPSRIPVSPTP